MHYIRIKLTDAAIGAIWSSILSDLAVEMDQAAQAALFRRAHEKIIVPLYREFLVANNFTDVAIIRTSHHVVSFGFRSAPDAVRFKLVLPAKLLDRFVTGDDVAELAARGKLWQ